MMNCFADSRLTVWLRRLLRRVTEGIEPSLPASQAGVLPTYTKVTIELSAEREGVEPSRQSVICSIGFQPIPVADSGCLS